MYGFLFWQDRKDIDEKLFSTKYIEKLKTIIPFDEEELTFSYSKINKFNLILYKPNLSNAVKLIHTYDNKEYFCLFFGELFREKNNPAELIVKYYSPKNTTAGINGNFAYIIYDKKEDKLFFSCDFIGRRKLYYYLKEDIFSISNLDILLVPFIKNKIEYNKVNIGLTLSLIASPEGSSYINGVDCINADYEFCYKNYNVEKKGFNYNKILQNKADMESIKKEFYNYIEFFIKDKKHIDVDLTAGLDSRTVLAALLKYKDISITTRTLGNSGVDYNTAKIISYFLKIKNCSPEVEFADYEKFIKHAEYLSFCSNGDALSLRAALDIEKDLTRENIKFVGTLGLVLIKNMKVNSNFKDFLDNSLIKIPLKYLDSDLNKQMQERVKVILENLYSLYPEKYFDMQFVREDSGTWGKTIFASTWNLRHLTPYEDIDFLLKFYSLPEEEIHTVKVQYDIIRENSKFLYYYPLNGNIFNNDFLFMKNRKLYDKLYNTCDFMKRIKNFGLRKIDKILNKENTIQERIKVFKKYYYLDIKNKILESNSIANLLLSKQELNKKLYYFEKNNADYKFIAKLYSMELWRGFVEKFGDLDE